MKEAGMQDANPGRRSALQRIGAVAGAAALGPFVHTTARAADPLFINTWGGVWDRAAQGNLFDPFTKETGIPIRTVSPVSYAKLASQVRTGVYEFDVTSLGGGDLVRAAEAGLIEKVDESIIDVASLAPGQRIGEGIGCYAFATVMAYRKDRVRNGPQSWAQFWDTQAFPGSRSLQRYPARVLPLALLAAGVPKDKLYPIDLDLAFKTLDRIKPQVRVWWSQGQQSQQLLRDGEVDAIGIWHSRVVELLRENVPVELVWNEAQIDRGHWVVAKGTPRAKQAWRFIASALRPERTAGFCMQADYAPVDPRVFNSVPEEAAKFMPTYPPNYKLAVEQDVVKLAQQLPEITRRFEQWIVR